MHCFYVQPIITMYCLIKSKCRTSKSSRFDKKTTTMTSVELRGEEITDLPRRSSQLNTQLKQRRKESLEKKNRLAGIQTLTVPFPLPHPTSIVFFFVLGSAIARLNLVLFEPHTQKKIPLATQANEPLCFMNSYPASFNHSLNLFWMFHSCAYLIPLV